MSPLPTLERAQAMGIPVSAVQDPDRYRVDPNASMFSTAQAERELGWRARLPFESLLGETLKGYNA
jgi:nucleoside-diphosphate-sugar epimerase